MFCIVSYLVASTIATRIGLSLGLQGLQIIYVDQINYSSSSSSNRIATCKSLLCLEPRMAQDSRFKIQDIFIRPVVKHCIVNNWARETATKTSIGRCHSSHQIYFQTGIGVLVWLYMEN